jgi:hypothetical protein
MPHRLTTPAPPEAWLLLFRSDDGWRVCGEYESPDHPELLQQRASFLEHGHEMQIVRDDPALDVLHDGLWLSKPVDLRVRDNWFLRHAAALEPYLVEPRVATAFTYSPGKLTDPLCTFKADTAGPCPLPKGTPWPECGSCNTPLVMVGVLDFRGFTEIPVRRGSLVLHGCPSCGLCADEETWSLHWLLEGAPLDLHGDPSAEVQLGTRWQITEYPTPEWQELKAIETLRHERSMYLNFVSSFDKVGGHVYWIQGDEFVNTPYVYIGQMTGEDESLRYWDSAVVYLMYSFQTGKTIASLQSF